MFSFRSKLFIYISILVTVVVLASNKLLRHPDEKLDKNTVLLQVVMQGLNTAHFQPEKVDDSFSKKVFDLYLKRLDVNKKFLTQEDLNLLKKYQVDIDDQVKKGSHTFFELATKLYQARVKETEGFYKEILAKPFDFTKDETIETNPDKLTAPANKAALKEAWRKYLKYQTLGQLSELMDMQEKAKERGDAKETKTFAQLEAEARQKVAKTYADFYNRLAQASKEDQFSLYMNAIANTYDPHTEYLAPEDKANFDIEMTGRLEGIGAQLQERDGQIKVMEIVPGSASYRQGELKPGDIILKVGQGTTEPVSVEGMRLDNAIKLIRGKKGTEVRLTVKKPDGVIKIIPIVREVVIIEETYAQSALIEENGKQIGYIRLPKFYADFQRRGGRNSGEDMRKEVEKLKREGADGIILDLRSNGGGSLSDAVEMSGLFIPQGPVVQVETSGSAPVVLEDKDPKVQFDGPVVVMVNSFSASASEIVAAAMQDYNRAVIIGSPTYGKGTVQQVFDLDQAIQGGSYAALKPFGSLKLTTQKFYRINGGATQLRGVTPDILLPDVYSFLEQGEKDQEHPLPWDEIKPARYQPWSPSPNLATLKAKSQERIQGNNNFAQITQQAQRMKKRIDQSQQSLKLTTYRAELKASREESMKFDTLEKSLHSLNVRPLTSDLTQVKSDTIKVGRYNKFAKKVQKDIYIHEATNVIQDQF